jgi:hypothetical protein
VSKQCFELERQRWIALVGNRRRQHLDDRLIAAELLEMLEGEVERMTCPALVDGGENLRVLAFLTRRSN